MGWTEFSVWSMSDEQKNDLRQIIGDNYDRRGDQVLCNSHIFCPFVFIIVITSLKHQKFIASQSQLN